MVNETRRAARGKRSWLIAAIALTLAAPAAWAGPKEDTEQAEKEFAKGDLVLSLSLWRKAAGAGYAPAQVWLGEILDKAEEDAEAVDWYRKAAAQGDAAGEFGLGGMYAKGEGVKQDFAQALSYIGRAADKGHLHAVLAMKDLTAKGGMGMKPDPAQNAVWSAKATEILAQEKAAAKTGKQD